MAVKIKEDGGGMLKLAIQSHGSEGHIAMKGIPGGVPFYIYDFGFTNYDLKNRAFSL